MNAVIEVGFDYSLIDADGRDDVRDAAVRIRVRMSRTVEDIIEIGRDLNAVKRALAHGQFGRWIEAEFGMSVMSASRFMNAADRFGDRINTVIDLAPSVLYALAAPSTPDAVVEEVVSRVEAGEQVTRDDVAALKAEKKELRRELDAAKLAAKDAKATQNDFGYQLQELREEVAGLRDQRDTLQHELDRARRGAVGQVKSVSAFDDAEAHEKQVAAIVSAWNKASKEAREDFLSRVDTPVFDRSAA